jgi:hypothetical protein
MDAWLSRAADDLARAATVDRASLELSDADIEALLDVARTASHESGARTNAPLLCFLLGLAAARDTSLPQLIAALRAAE